MVDGSTVSTSGEFTGDGTHHDLSKALALLPLAAMYGGAALYLLANVAFKYRIVRRANVHRSAAGGTTASP